MASPIRIFVRNFFTANIEGKRIMRSRGIESRLTQKDGRHVLVAITRSPETNGKHFKQVRERIERRADEEPHAM